MHVYFSGIGGAAIGPLAVIAKQAGYEVSGSDARDSSYLKYLTAQGISDIHIGQSQAQIAAVHKQRPIDWLVYTSALPPNSPELLFCKQHGIKTTKRADLINAILSQNNLRLIAVAGTHGKTTTTAMLVWLFQQLNLSVSWSLGARTAFSEMGHFDAKSQFFVYEADEFDRNFLAFKPRLAIITGLAWDHHEIFETQANYFEAFRQFVAQSHEVVLWQADARALNLNKLPGLLIESENNTFIDRIKLIGRFNRFDGWLAVRAAAHLTQDSPEKLVKLISQFPGVSRRFEKLRDNLYTDYAHTPEKIRGVMSVALETVQKTAQKIVIIYEPLTNRRMHYTRKFHREVFDGLDALYWVPTYLAREDTNQPILTPDQLIADLDEPAKAVARPMELDERLKAVIEKHLEHGDLVIGLSGGGGGSLDEWLRQNFKS